MTRRFHAWVAWRLLRTRVQELEARDGKDRWYGAALTVASRYTPLRARVAAGRELWKPESVRPNCRCDGSGYYYSELPDSGDTEGTYVRCECLKEARG